RCYPAIATSCAAVAFRTRRSICDLRCEVSSHRPSAERITASGSAPLRGSRIRLSHRPRPTTNRRAANEPGRTDHMREHAWLSTLLLAACGPDVATDVASQALINGSFAGGS